MLDYRKLNFSHPCWYLYTKVGDYTTDYHGTRIGAAFLHPGKKGCYNILLDAWPIPVGGRVHLLAYTAAFDPFEQRLNQMSCDCDYN